MRGRCTCGEVVFRLTRTPLFVHACHCRWCQRETGSAFVMNALIETEAVEIEAGTPEVIRTPSASGRGQDIARCPTCRVALWSVYAGAGPLFRFVRVGTLEDPDACPPDVHIYTASKQPWVILPEGVPATADYYDRRALWPEDALARRQAVLDRAAAAAEGA